MHLEKGSIAKVDLKVCFISEAFGGIADYTKFLICELKENYPISTSAIWLSLPSSNQENNLDEFVSHHGNILRLSSPEEFKEPLINLILQETCHIIHFQFELSFFPLCNDFIDLLAKIREKTSKNVIITFHSIYFDPYFNQFIRSCTELVDAIILHQENAQGYLLSLGLDPDKLFVIPHGTPFISSDIQKISLFKTKLFKIAMVGFIKKNKSFNKALLSISSEKDFEIVIAGMIKELDILQDLLSIKEKALATINLIPRYLSYQELIALISEADCLILPYEQDYFSSSGILHLITALQKPVLVSSSPKFKELTNVNPFCEVNDNDYLTPIRALQNPEILRKIKKVMKFFSEKTSWRFVAKRTFTLYNKIIYPFSENHAIDQSVSV
ncbi:MAG: glycosyltransferase [Candidatus Hodarchaeales archaeon]|jgi:hypothetical protein